MKADQQKAFDSIVRQWNGGSHVVAGARASELVYGASKKPNDKMLAEFIEAVPGIEKYITAPKDGAIEEVPERSVPTTQGPGEANLSTDEAKKEQSAIDKTLEKGRNARKDDDIETRLNPKGDGGKKS